MSGEDDGTDVSFEGRPKFPRPRPSNELLLYIAFISFVIFTIIQTVVSFTVAHSAAMQADCAAMAVDAATYGLNLWAERKKKKYISMDDGTEGGLIRTHRSILLLEFYTPALSIIVLLSLTVFVTSESLRTLFPNTFPGGDSEESPNARLMLIFSILNLVLDFINVFFFACAGNLFGFMPLRNKSSQKVTEGSLDVTEESTEEEGIGGNAMDGERNKKHELGDISITLSKIQSRGNMNMCSAYTHIVADTLRSIAVILAAICVLFFDVDDSKADATAALVVSFIIILNIVPLLKGLYSVLKILRRLSIQEDLRNEVSC
eukprot:CAMPEP_0194312836 /NCGR_PEP_ID=MMETSP0171-20130528/9766_1 /TAXON_ID=218684 /ORGANISM="Corethron pennatum, Strain L29A3" /LENGTH=317 /DNA_ID=CAMNT_0039067537 /DNA_START=200 /DNA_END=1153 /DNA_ORIENTATION=+